jgi:hypothetical protein
MASAGPAAVAAALSNIENKQQQQPAAKPREKPASPTKQQQQPRPRPARQGAQQAVVVEDDSKPGFRDLGAGGHQTVLLRPPFSLF